MRRLLLFAGLLARFVLQVVVSGVATAWMIVRPGPPPAPGLVRMRIEGLSPVGAALLGCMVTLTPGTTTVDVDLERGELLLHLLDASDAASVVSGIRHELEGRLRRLFPAGAMP